MCSEPGHQVSRLDVYLQVLPPVQLRLIVVLTNERATHMHVTTSTELLKYFGIMILATCCQFANRRSKEPVRHRKPFGCTGMTHHRFDILLANIWYSRQLENRPAGMSSESYRWTLEDDFVYYGPSYNGAEGTSEPS
jgi:Transposase IS4